MILPSRHQGRAPEARSISPGLPLLSGTPFHCASASSHFLHDSPFGWRVKSPEGCRTRSLITRFMPTIISMPPQLNWPILALLLPLLSILMGCSSTKNAKSDPVIVQVTEAPSEGDRYRSNERQRDVWIAPQAIDHETLQHEQLVTFVERPTAWQLPNTIEPDSVSEPKLPLQQGEYQAEALKRQSEIAIDLLDKLQAVSTELDSSKKQSSQKLDEKDAQIRRSEQELQSTRDELIAAKKRLDDMAAAKKLKQEEDSKLKSKPWWKVWQ